MKRKLDDTQEQISMFQEMLAAKDEVVMNLTNQIFELEQKKGGASREYEIKYVEIRSGV